MNLTAITFLHPVHYPGSRLKHTGSTSWTAGEGRKATFEGSCVVLQHANSLLELRVPLSSVISMTSERPVQAPQPIPPHVPEPEVKKPAGGKRGRKKADTKRT